jgi:hypothetical protein
MRKSKRSESFACEIRHCAKRKNLVQHDDGAPTSYFQCIFMNRDEKLKITSLIINKNNLLGLDGNKQSLATITSS